MEWGTAWRKKENKLPKDLWITSSDDFASWGGGDTAYQNSDLEDLIRAVDYISMHTYPFHNTHYNPAFWEVNQTEALGKTQKELIEEAMIRARDFAVDQYRQVKKYMESLGVNKPIHIPPKVAAIGIYLFKYFVMLTS